MHTSSVRIGRLGLPAHQVVENILAGVKTIATRVPQGFRNYQSLHLKTVDSIALPIYNSLPPQPTRLPGVGEEESTPVIKRIKLDEGSEGISDEEEQEDEELEDADDEVVTREQTEEEIGTLSSEDVPPSPTVKKSKKLRVSDYVDSTLKHSTVAMPMTSGIRGGVKRKVSSRRSIQGRRVRTLSLKKVRGSTVISSQFEKAQRKRKRRTLN